MQYDVILWLLVLVIAGVGEAVTAGLTSVWFMAGALVAFLCAFFPIPMAGQIAVFLIVSLVSMYFLRPVAKKYFMTHVQSTNADRVIGQRGLVLKDILPGEGKTGQVKVMGQIWTALSADGESIAAGASVTVKEISGVKLIVVPASAEKPSAGNEDR